MPCGADGLLGDADDAADISVFQAHLVEAEKEGFHNCLPLSRKLFVPLQAKTYED